MSKVDLSKKSVLFATSTGGDMLHIYKDLKNILKDVEIIRNKKSDPNNKSSFYEIPLVEYKNQKDFLIKKAKKFDIIHISYHWKIVHWMKSFYPDKKIVYHLRGSEIRNNTKLVNSACELSDIILYSTEDLITYLTDKNKKKAHYMFRAIDTKHFHKRDIKSNKKVCFWKGNIIHYKKHFDHIPEMEYIERNSIPYKDLPNLLSQYEEFYNIRFTKEGEIIKGVTQGSKLMLEALSIGLICYTWDMKEVKKLPKEYYPENVVKSLVEKYKKLFN
jgi:hypothetical protein